MTRHWAVSLDGLIKSNSQLGTLSPQKPEKAQEVAQSDKNKVDFNSFDWYGWEMIEKPDL